MAERIDLPPVSPGGAEYTLMAARVAGITATTRCLTIGLAHTPAAITLAQHLGCHVTALTRSPERALIAQTMAETVGVASLVSFQVVNPLRIPIPNESYDFIVAEGGGLTNFFPSPDAGLARIVPLLSPGGALAVSDLVYPISPPPETVRDRFPTLWTERRYTLALENSGLTILFGCWVARRGWREFIAASGAMRDFWESRDARAGLAYLYLVARQTS